MNTVQLAKPPRSTFDLTHAVDMSHKGGCIYPVLCREALPGDTFTLGADVMMRLAPMLAPVFTRMDMFIHYWFVPNRIMWDGFEDFITQTPGAGAHPTIKIAQADSADRKRFNNYFGIPAINLVGREYAVNAFPWSAYQMIYNEYYRDQNLISEVNFSLTAGNNTLNTDLFVLRNRAWEHDYFTSNLPWAQKGVAVSLPLGDVQLKNEWDTILGLKPSWSLDDLTSSSGPGMIIVPPVIPKNIEITDTGGNPIAYNPAGTLEVGATTINDLRTAEALQKFLERNAVGGTRYKEHLLAHFNEHANDFRLQRPEYIVGIKTPVQISEVLNTTGPTEFFDGGAVEQTGSPQGDMSGHGVAGGSGRFARYHCSEHGWIIGTMSVLPRSGYQQGIPREFFKEDYTDYAFPEFAHLGERATLAREIYADAAVPTAEFGYLPQYAEYRTAFSRTAGDFQTTLDFWLLTRKFATEPTLSQAFVECVPEDFERIFAVQDGTDYFWSHIVHKIGATRPLPFYGQPKLTG